jgi:type VI secretion system protein ImpK
VADEDPFGFDDDEEKTVLKPMPGGMRGGHRPPPVAPLREEVFQEPGEEPPALTAYRRRALNPLERVASPLLALISRLRKLPAHPDPAALRDNLIEELKRFDAGARQAGVAAKTALSARYALCTVIDEMVLGTPWGNTDLWRQHSLLTTFHNDTRGGEKFFSLLKQAAQDSKANIDFLELLYVCLSLGFQGRYRLMDRGREQLAQLRERLFEIIRRERGAISPELSPPAQPAVVEAPRLARFLPLWVAGAALALLATGSYMGFSIKLAQQSDPVLADLQSLSKARDDLAIRRPPPPAPRPILKLSALLEEDIEAGRIEVTEQPGSATVVVRGHGLFPPGSASVGGAYRPVFERLAAALMRIPGPVLIVGHTDNIPMRSARYPSNWHLSEARANSVREMLGKLMGGTERLRSEGRGEREPLVPNDTRTNRALNRRVEVILSYSGEAARSPGTTPP